MVFYARKYGPYEIDHEKATVKTGVGTRVCVACKEPFVVEGNWATCPACRGGNPLFDSSPTPVTATMPKELIRQVNGREEKGTCPGVFNTTHCVLNEGHQPHHQGEEVNGLHWSWGEVEPRGHD